ncbi:hypothetical protein ACYOEI_01910 [Singulisphaera rosea]
MTTLKVNMIVTGLAVAFFSGPAGMQSPACAAQSQGAGKSATSNQSQPPSGHSPGGSVPASIDPGSKWQPVGTSTRILWAKLNTAVANRKRAKEAHATNQALPEHVIAARGEVETLVAEILSRADDLRDEVDLLEVQLEISKANVQAAEIQKAKAVDSQESTGKLVKERVVGPAESVTYQRDVDLRGVELAKAQAELKGITLRIKQTTRRRDEAIDLAEKASKLVAEQEPSSPAPSTAKH